MRRPAVGLGERVGDPLGDVRGLVVDGDGDGQRRWAHLRVPGRPGGRARRGRRPADSRRRPRRARRRDVQKAISASTARAYALERLGVARRQGRSGHQPRHARRAGRASASRVCARREGGAALASGGDPRRVSRLEATQRQRPPPPPVGCLDPLDEVAGDQLRERAGRRREDEQARREGIEHDLGEPLGR